MASERPKSAAEPIALELSSPNFFIIYSPPKRIAPGTRHVPVDHAATAHLPLRFKRIVVAFIESSASVAVLQHVRLACATTPERTIPAARRGRTSARPPP